MARVIPLLLALLACTYAGADDAADAEAKIREYFDAFNAQDIDSITRDVYSIPVHIANQAGHRAYITGKDAATSLAGLYEQIEEQGWVESVIREVNVCVIADGLAFAEVRYTRNRKDGTAIAPGLRTNIYVVQELPQGWRIVAFYGKDPDKNMTCS
jgi:hypothetical protein